MLIGALVELGSTIEECERYFLPPSIALRLRLGSTIEECERSFSISGTTTPLALGSTIEECEHQEYASHEPCQAC